MIKIKELKLFENKEFGQIRNVFIGDKPYFVASDVAKCLGYKDTTNAVKQHCRWVVKHHIPHPQSNTKTLEVNVIPKGDIYRLVSNSELETAEKFESWVFDEVLPTICDTGGYVNNDDTFISTYLPYADDSTKLMFKSTLQTVRKQNEIIKTQQAELTHKEDIIIGLVDDITLAEKRQILNRVVRFNHANYQQRWSLLYREFENKYHIDLQRRIDSYNLINKPKCKSKIQYIDNILNKIPELYEIAVKLFETDVETLIEQLYKAVS